MPEQTLKEKTATGLMWTGGGVFIMQALNAFFGIFIARILFPEDYGIIGLLTIFAQIASSLQESGLTSALINKKNCQQEDYNAVFWFSLLMSLTLYTILFFSTPLIARFYHIPELKTLGRVSFLCLVTSAVGIVPYAILMKEIRSEQITKGNLLASLVSGFGGVAMAMAGMAYWGLVFQSLGAYVLRVFVFWFVTKWKPSFRINLRPIIPMLKFGIYILLTRIFEAVSVNILTIFLGRFFGKTEVGYYNQAGKWNYMLYSSLLSMSAVISQPVFAKTDDEEERSRRVLRKMTRFMAFVSFPCMFGLALIAPEFIVLALTDKWMPSVPLLQVLAIGGAFLPLSNIFSSFVLSRGKSFVMLIMAVCLSIIQLAVAYLFRHDGIFVMTIAYTSVSVAWLLVWQLVVRREIRLRLRDTIKDVAPFALIAAGVMFAVHFITLSINHLALRLLAKIVLAVGLYCLSMRLSHSHIYAEFVAYAKGGWQKFIRRKK